MGPLYELGGAALEGVLTKAGELLEKVNELRAFAGKSREAAAEARRLAQEGKQLGKSAEDIAQQEALAVEAEEAAVKAEQEATTAEQTARKAEDDVAEAKLHNCFVAGTPVLMADGTLKPIEQVKTGDLVESKDPLTGREGAKRVLRTFRNTAAVLLTLTLGNGERITTTPGHPFATNERGGFTLTGKLSIGDTLKLNHNVHSSLRSETAQAGSFATFNFEVEDWHTYFVGKSAVWVHNQSTPTTIKVDMNSEAWQHMCEEHLPGGGPFNPAKSQWSISETEISCLVDDVAALKNPVPQTGQFEGNFAWTTHVEGNPIGISVEPPVGPTNWYTVITDAAGNFITAFPGFPPTL